MPSGGAAAIPRSEAGRTASHEPHNQVRGSVQVVTAVGSVVMDCGTPIWQELRALDAMLRSVAPAQRQLKEQCTRRGLSTRAQAGPMEIAQLAGEFAEISGYATVMFAITLVVSLPPRSVINPSPSEPPGHWSYHESGSLVMHGPFRAHAVQPVPI